MELEFFASCLGGLEGVLASELRTFGIERVRPLKGGVAFFCAFEHAYRACLWSRLASRILLVLGRANASDASLLYAGAYDIAWEDVLAADATFSVRANGTNEELRNTRFTSLKVKDAIVDRLQARQEHVPRVDTASPRATIDVRVRDRRATISLDFSGEALNHRAYLLEDDRKDAPFECTLMAGALALGGWDKTARLGTAFVDPACRDGVLLVEAASVACDLAPALERKRWGFMGWAGHDGQAWEILLDEAHGRFERGYERLVGAPPAHDDSLVRPDLSRVRFAGASTSSPSISRAREHVKRAGLRQVASVELGDATSVAELVVRVTKVSQRRRLAGPEEGGALECVVACNLDARSREDARAHVRADESAFLAAAASTHDPSRFIAVAPQDVSARFDGHEGERFAIGNRRVETTVEVYRSRPSSGFAIEIPDLAGGAPRTVEAYEKGSEQFAARLRKVFKERRKWASRNGVSCYRLYDADLPDYAVAIDWYAGAGGAKGNSYLHIAEYAAPSSVDADKARRRFNDVLAIAPVVCGVRPDHVFSKRRLREKGGGQYRNAGQRAYPTTVEEGGYLFEVDLAGRLDTGLFLDHRSTRALIEKRASGARFLNLFAYTGTASVYAAGGHAKSTMTVDLSQTYLDWARRNMQANGFSGSAHAYERADVMRWITEARRSGKRFDFIFVDPPTFSNSKAMGKKTWDVQRDHVELLIGVTHLLSERGEALFSCNLRTFRPYLSDLERYGVEIEDISASTIPEDFSRTPKIHKCYLVRRR